MPSIERRKNGVECDAIVVSQGEIKLVKDDHPLMAVVGRGVVVCIWDRVDRTAGMSHFTEPATYDPKQATCRYGNVSVLTLILLIKGQSPKGNFEAHIFGGAALDSNDGRGHANIAMARKVLSSRGISIATEDVGGSKGRKILFDPETGHVAVLKVHSIRREDWEN